MDDQLKLVNIVLQRMQKTLECTICLDLLQNPYTTKCHHSFCNECLDRLFLETKGSTKCPLCNGPVTKRSLTQNPKIVSFVRAVKKIILSIKEDFGFSEVPPKPSETNIRKRVPRKREQTIPFDAQINMLPRIMAIKKKKPGTMEEMVQKKSKVAGKSKIFPETSTSNNILKDHNKSVEKVTDWLTKSCTVELYRENDITSVNDENNGNYNSVAMASQQSTVIFEHSQKEQSEFQNVKTDEQFLNTKNTSILINKSALNTKSNIENVPHTSNTNLMDGTVDATKNKRKLNYEMDAIKQPTKIRKNIRFASEVKTMLLEDSRNASVPVKRRTKKSPGWGTIDNTKRELRSQVRALNITGGEKKSGNSSRCEIYSNNPIQTQDSIMVIDDESQNSKLKPKLRKEPMSNIETYLVRRKVNVKQRQPATFLHRSPKNLIKDNYPMTLKSLKTAIPEKGIPIAGDLNLKPSNKPVDEVMETEDEESLVRKIAVQKVEAVVNTSSKTINYTVDKKCGSFDNKISEPVPNPSGGEPLVADCANSGLVNNDEHAICNLGTPSRELTKNLPSSSSINLSNNSFPEETANVNNLRNISDSTAPKKELLNCYHSIPCHLFKALKMFVLSQKCHSEEKESWEPVAPVIPSEVDDCVASHLTDKGSAYPNCTAYKGEDPSVSTMPADIAVDLGIVTSSVGSLTNEAAVHLDNSNCSPLSNMDGDHPKNGGEGIICEKLSSELNLDESGKQNKMEVVNSDGHFLSFSSGHLPIENKALNNASIEREENIMEKFSTVQVRGSNVMSAAATSSRTPVNCSLIGSNFAASSPPAISSRKHADNCSINDSIFPTKMSFEKKSDIITYGKRKLKNTEGENKRYKRSKATNSSDSSNQETTGKNTEEEKYQLNSDEWRDFERFDDNVLKSFSTKMSMGEEAPENILSIDNEKYTPSKPENAAENLDNLFRSCSDERLHEADSSEDEIPGTEETMMRMKDNLNECVDLRNLNELENENSLKSTQVQFSQSTENLINKCNQSLHRAEELLEKEATADFVHPDGQLANISFASAVSTQSAFISTQKKDMMESEVMKLRAEIDALEDLKKKKTIEKTLLHKPTPVSDTRIDSMELFSTAASSREIETCSNTGLESTLVPSISEDKENLNSKSMTAQRKLVSKRNYKNKRILIVCTGLSVSEVNLTQQFAAKICKKNSKVVATWNPSVSHVIVQTNEDGVTERTLKYLYGVASGAWIVSIDWVTESLKIGKLLKEDSYEALDCTGVAGPRRGRHLLCHVFDGCQLYLIPPFSNLSLLQIKDLVSICGADVVSDTAAIADTDGMKMVIVNATDSNEVVDSSKFDGFIGVTYDWLIECIGMASRISLMPYIVGEPTGSQVTKSGIPIALLCETQNVW